MRKIFIFLAVISLFGCVSSEVDEYDYGFTPNNLSANNQNTPLTNIGHIYLGMTIKDIKSIMGDNVEIGYYKSSDNKGKNMPITINSPYKKEMLKIKGKNYNVFYYFVGIRNPDGKIDKDELMPLIFSEDKLIGKGYKFLAKIQSE